MADSNKLKIHHVKQLKIEKVRSCIHCNKILLFLCNLRNTLMRPSNLTAAHDVLL